MRSSIIVLAFVLSAPQTSHAQGTTYVSTLGLTPTGSASVGSDSWLAQLFQTGTNAVGYLLDSVQLAFTNASGNPSGFKAMIYNNGAAPSGVNPGTNLCTLNGSLDPVTTGVYTYTPTSSLALPPRTAYFIVLTAGTPVANGTYMWSVASPGAPSVSDGWGANLALRSSSDGSNWRFPTPYTFAQFAISGTPVPESTAIALLALGGGLLLCHPPNR
jgi:hypothetical protein